jgi:hypothetical protein
LSCGVQTAAPQRKRRSGYADEGKYKVDVTVNDVGGSTASATSHANIADAPLTATGATTSGTEGVTTGTVTVATFTDANPNATASDFTATINWGDGTSTAGTIVAQSGGGFAVDGSHSYANDGRYTIGINVDDIGGSSASATSTADVSAPQVALTINPVDGNNVINHAEAHTAGGISIKVRRPACHQGRLLSSPSRMGRSQKTTQRRSKRTSHGMRPYLPPTL